MNKTKSIRLACIMMAAMFGLSACGSKDVEVTDYGLIQTSDSNETGSAEGSSNQSDSWAFPNGSGKKLSEMLGGNQVEYNKSFILNGKSATIDVAYNIKDTDALSVYRIEPIDGDAINSDDVAKKFFGDTSMAIYSDSRKYITKDLGDSVGIIYACMAVSYHNGGTYNYMSPSHVAWEDTDEYYIHTYEGKYLGVEYQLLVSFSKKYNELVVALYPKKIGEVVGDEKLDNYEASCPDGKFYYYKGSTLKEYTLDDVMTDRPNDCTLTDNELAQSAIDTLKNYMDVSIPEEAISFYDNIHGVVIPEGAEQKKNEIIFFNDDSLDTEDLEGAIRSGYSAGVMSSLCNQTVMTETEVIDNSAEDLQVGALAVNNSGVIGFSLALKYSFSERLADNVAILSFDKAMDSFIEGASNNLDSSNLELADDTIEFGSVDLVYYPTKSENESEYMMVPAWSVEAQNKNKQTVVRVLINAIDGSYITALNEE